MATTTLLEKLRSKAAAATAAAAILALALSGCSGAATSGAAATAKAGTAITGSTSLFDAGASHSVSLSWDDADYDAMIAAYETDSDKAWISADITIDGTLIKNVGVRLKGNSTLRSLGGTQGGGGMGGGGDRPAGQPPAGTDGTRPTDLPTDMAGGGPGGAGMAPAGGGGMDTSSGISADDPASLPLLIRFDKYVKGTRYEGLTELAVRPGSPVINEALALSITAATGQATQRYAYTTYSVNGSATQTRLLLENPDEAYAENLADAGGTTGNTVVFKADADSSFSYQGEDLATYADQFKQLNKTDSQDATPIVKFLKWLQDADAATFDAELADWVDVDSFAKYAATQNLLANSDDMSGPGQNYYLSYDLSTKKISVISWDLNLALSGNATADPDADLSMGGGRGGAGGNGAGVGGTAQNTASTGSFKSRFLASATFKKLYDSAYQELYAQVFAKGTAKSLLADITASIPASDSQSAEDIAAKSATVGTFLDQRGTALEKALAG